MITDLGLDTKIDALGIFLNFWPIKLIINFNPATVDKIKIHKIMKTCSSVGEKKQKFKKKHPTKNIDIGKVSLNDFLKRS